MWKLKSVRQVPNSTLWIVTVQGLGVLYETMGFDKYEAMWEMALYLGGRLGEPYDLKVR